MKGGFSNGMDPQKLSKLDPKLREAYQRVMGTEVSQTQVSPVSQSQPEPQPEVNAQPNISAQQAPTQSSAFFTPTPNFATPVPQAQPIITERRGNPLMLIAVGIAVLVFVVIYGLFWARVFNLKLPFLP